MSCCHQPSCLTWQSDLSLQIKSRFLPAERCCSTPWKLILVGQHCCSCSELTVLLSVAAPIIGFAVAGQTKMHRVAVITSICNPQFYDLLTTPLQVFASCLTQHQQHFTEGFVNLNVELGDHSRSIRPNILQSKRSSMLCCTACRVYCTAVVRLISMGVCTAHEPFINKRWSKMCGTCRTCCM